MSILVRNLKYSPDRCGEAPTPDEANEIFPGLALAYSMNSWTVLTGSDGVTTMMFGARATMPTGDELVENIGEFFVERRTDGDGRAGEQQGVAVGRGVDHRLGSERAAGAGAVLHCELIAHVLGEKLRNQAGDERRSGRRRRGRRSFGPGGWGSRGRQPHLEPWRWRQNLRPGGERCGGGSVADIMRSDRLIIFADFLMRAQHGVDRLEHVAHARFRHRAFDDHDELRLVG